MKALQDKITANSTGSGALAAHRIKLTLQGSRKDMESLLEVAFQSISLMCDLVPEATQEDLFERVVDPFIRVWNLQTFHETDLSAVPVATAVSCANVIL